MHRTAARILLQYDIIYDRYRNKSIHLSEYLYSRAESARNKNSLSYNIDGSFSVVQHKQRVLYFLFILTVVTIVAHYAASFFDSKSIISLIIMWSPGLTAIIVGLATHRSFRDIGWNIRPLKWLAAGWMLPIVYAGTAYGAIWLLNLGDVPNPVFLERVDWISKSSTLQRHHMGGVAPARHPFRKICRSRYADCLSIILFFCAGYFFRSNFCLVADEIGKHLDRCDFTCNA